VRRFQLALILALAVLVPGQLLLHNHPLIPEGGGVRPPVCGVCAFGADTATAGAPVLFLHLAVSWLLVSAVQAIASTDATSLVPSRAPPRA
jgi:hypothetical protein